MTGQTTAPAPERSWLRRSTNRQRVVVGALVVLCQALVVGLALPAMTRDGPPAGPPALPQSTRPPATQSPDLATPIPEAQAAVPEIPESVEWVKPSPMQAPRDLPVAYADQCQVGIDASTPSRCVYGKESGSTTLALVGDSKVLQWLPAVQVLASSSNWRIVVYTKAACALADAKTLMNGRPYESCATWNTRVMRELTGSDGPDYVITSQGSNKALNSAGKLTADALKAGLRRSWAKLTKAGIKVLVLADNPDPRRDVYECVAENLHRLSRCRFNRADGITASGAPVQRSAAAGMTGVEIVDLTDTICPTAKCPPVIGHVLLYRKGSHLTATFVKSLARQLRMGLTAAGLPPR